jgi:hypothetical protein
MQMSYFCPGGLMALSGLITCFMWCFGVFIVPLYRICWRVLNSLQDEALSIIPSISLPSNALSFAFKRRFTPSNKLRYNLYTLYPNPGEEYPLFLSPYSEVLVSCLVLYVLLTNVLTWMMHVQDLYRSYKWMHDRSHPQ